MKIMTLGRSTAVAATLFATGMVSAATVDPADFDSIVTEGQRTTTIGGTSGDVAGNAAVSGNGDVGTFEIDPTGNTLIVGRVTGTGQDAFSASAVTGLATVTVLNYAEAVRQGVSPFSATFEFFAGGVLVNSATLGGSAPGVISGVTVGQFDFNGEDLEVVISSNQGASDFDVGVNIAPVPLPAAGFLMFGALGGLAAMRRRKKA